MNQLGDFLFSLPAVAGMRQTYPGARLVSVVRPNLYELAARTPAIDAVIVRDYGPFYACLPLVRDLRDLSPDMAVLFSQSASSVILAAASGAPRRLGFQHSDFKWLLTDRAPISYPPAAADMARLALAAGAAPSKSYAGMVQASESDLAAAADLLGGSGPFVVLAPGASAHREFKQWPVERWRSLAAALDREGLRPVITGAASDRALAREIRGGCSFVLDLTGTTGIASLIGVLASAAVVVTVDNGAMHLAAALGVPVVALFGPTSHELTGPQSELSIVVRQALGCSPCFVGCSDCRCMSEIGVEQVLIACRKGLYQRFCGAGAPGNAQA